MLTTSIKENSMATVDLELDDIQGNILGGFNKDYQTFLFLKFKGADVGRTWITLIANPDSELGLAGSSSTEVLKFNAQFKALRAEGIKPESVIEAAWTNLAISFAGLKALGVKPADLNAFPKDFSEGMATRRALIGDQGTSDPSSWIKPFGTSDIHAVLQVAADNEHLLNVRVLSLTGTNEFKAGVTVVHREEGRTRLDEAGQAGHEHFGFKDGVSQPGIVGITTPDDPIGNPEQGHPGQDLLWPGEFVIGYPTGSEIDAPGPIRTSGPAWTKNGSYLVFRRLAQDVPAFRQHVDELAEANGLHPDLMGAKLVGRYKSGCPLEARAFQPTPFAPSPTDPGKTIPVLGDSDQLNNNFEFADLDSTGAICPLGSHIRKAYPRDELIFGDSEKSEEETQRHRILRRGIPFGGSFGAPKGGSAKDPRGLLFFCYQTTIENQFEFIQSKWVNNPNFPPFPAGVVAGQDPIIAQSPKGPFQLDPAKGNIEVKHFVTTTAGEYFFAPSISALQDIGAGKHS
jgi:Dyp-type peroxidase family